MNSPLIFILYLIEEWFGTVGRWNVEVTSVDLSEDNDKDPLVLVVVHRPNDYNEQVDGIETDKTPCK